MIQKNKEKKLKKSSNTWKKISRLYNNFCYNIFGKYALRNKRFDNINDRLKMANLRVTAELYISVIIVSGLIATLISLIIFTFIFQFIIQSGSAFYYILILTAMTTAISFSFYPYITRSRISTRRMQIDREIPFILSELSILASTGLTPIKIFRSMTGREENTAINLEFKKIIYKIDIDGKDIITAISDTAKETPSSNFREILWDIASMIHQGGALDTYLRKKADTTMQLKRDIQKEFIDKLGSYSEIYISLVLVGVLFLGITAFILDAMGSSFSGIDANTLLLLMSYGLIPLVVIVVNLLVSMAYSKTG
jgi:flagellar protein FlaJ